MSSESGPREGGHGRSSSLLSDPLLHFVLIGILLFVAVSQLGPRDADPPVEPSVEVQNSSVPKEIRITDSLARGLWRTHREMLGRELTEDEKSKVVRQYVDEEILVREARRLGLHENDARIRRRLLEKTRFLFVGPLPDPADGDLRSHYQNNLPTYVVPESISLEQVLVAKEQVEPGQRTDAVLEKLESGVDIEEVGLPSWLGPRLRELSRKDLVQLFGESAADSIWRLPDGKWGGPLHTSHGTQFFRITDRFEARLPEFESVSDRVAVDWRRDRTQRVLNSRVNEARDRYRIVIESIPNGDQ